MRLPNGEQAFIPIEKLSGYLLSETHPTGQSKARFFRALGFTAEHADVLIVAPDGRQVLVQTVWIIEPGESRPRFVTAYPA
jgi:hypothetical protein